MEERFFKKITIRPESMNTDKFSDDTFGKMIQQLRDREKSFLKNISTAYYEAIENKNYLNYETDSLDELEAEYLKLLSKYTGEQIKVVEDMDVDLIGNIKNT